MTIVFYFCLAVVVVLGWWAWPAADEAQIRIIYKPEDAERVERLRKVMQAQERKR